MNTIDIISFSIVAGLTLITLAVVIAKFVKHLRLS